MTETTKRLSLRDRAKMANVLLQRQMEVEEMYVILRDKLGAVERLLAAHHGAEAVTEEQIEMCLTCAPFLHKEGE